MKDANHQESSGKGKNEDVEESALSLGWFIFN